LLRDCAERKANSDALLENDSEAVSQEAAAVKGRSEGAWERVCEGARKNELNTSLVFLLPSLAKNGLRACPERSRGGSPRRSHTDQVKAFSSLSHGGEREGSHSAKLLNPIRMGEAQGVTRVC
jgi:hypothetical protein